MGDGLVALPADARTQEQLEWVADLVAEAGGSSTLWRAELTSRAQERVLIARLAEARAEEYAAITARALAALDAPQDATRALRGLRRELRQTRRRDFFSPPEQEQATAAVKRLAARLTTTAEPEVASS